MDIIGYLKNYEPATELASEIVPQVLDRFVVSGACAVNVTAVPKAAVYPSGTSSHTVYNVTTGDVYAPITLIYEER
jgi:hypothetical protein